MNPWSMAGWGIGTWLHAGNKTFVWGEIRLLSCLFEAAVSTTLHFPPTMNQLLPLADGTARCYFLHPRERWQRRRQLEQDGVWKEGADPSTGREETQERFSSIYPIPFPPAANEPPSQAWRESRLWVGVEKSSETPWEMECFIPIYSPIYLRLLELNYRKVNVEETDPRHVRESDLIFPLCQHVYLHYLVIFVMYRWSRHIRVILHGEAPMMEPSCKC